MQLKRFYETEPDGKLTLDKRGQPIVIGVSVKHTGVRREQNFSSRLVTRATAEGWMSVGKGRLTIHAKEGELVYTILRSSGHYCCHCGEALAGMVDAREHVAAKHKGAKSPDANNPSGYRVIDGYETTLDEAMHAKLRVDRQEA